MNAEQRPTVWTVGHSNRTVEQFMEILIPAGIQVVFDVRRYPTSRYNIQFNREELPNSLAEAGIQYRHCPAFGGMREERLPDSPNTAWSSEAFNAYADHTQSEAFQQALRELIETAATERVALMCAEASPYECHRRLISDALVAHHVEVVHLLSEHQLRTHTLTEFGRARDGVVIYPGGTLF